MQISEIEKIIGYTFKDKKYLEAAFTHSSFGNEKNTPHYERMEFLGDSIIGFLVAEYLFKTDRTLDPGQLTDLRKNYAENKTHAALADKLGLVKYIRHTLENKNGLSVKMKGNVIESTVAAVYLDSGNLENAKKFVYKFLINSAT